MSVTLIFIIQVFITLAILYFGWWVKSNAQRIGRYEADLQYLPHLTRELELIKNRLHDATELKLGIKGEEQRVIFEMADAISKAIDMCINIGTYIKDQHSEKG